MANIEPFVNIFRKKYIIPNLILCFGISYFLFKLFLIWFGSTNEVKVKLLDLNSSKEDTYSLKKKNFSLSSIEIIPRKNLFRPSRTEWIPPSPPPSFKPTLPTPKASPPPEITISGIIGGEGFSKRAIIEGQYYSPSNRQKKIKKRGYKLYEAIGPYQVTSIGNDKVILIGPDDKLYEFFLNRNKEKFKEIFSPSSKSRDSKLSDHGIKKWQPLNVSP